MASAALVTDEPDRLANDVADWPAWLATASLRSGNETARIRNTGLAKLLADPVLRRELLQRKLATTSFALYVYHASVQGPATRATMLFHRLRKRRPETSQIATRVQIAGDVAAAVARIKTEDHRDVAPPVIVRSRDSVATLAELALLIVARRLVARDDREARDEFEHVRSRVALTLNVVTGERHRREHDPL